MFHLVLPLALFSPFAEPVQPVNPALHTGNTQLVSQQQGEIKNKIDQHQPLYHDPIFSNQSVQNSIHFKSRVPNQVKPVPASIEFKSPSQANQPISSNQSRTVEVISDRQEYDERRRIITAEGNVEVRFDGAVVDADRLQMNLDNLIAVGEGNVALKRGDQLLRGERFTYNFIQDTGELEKGSGEIFVPAAQTDFALSPTNITAAGIPPAPLSPRITANQPLTDVGSPGGIAITVGGGGASNLPIPTGGGQVRRLRFLAQNIAFSSQGWQAENVRITNDPFSPPELELRARKVRSVRESPLVERITTEGQRLVLHQTLVLPVPVNRLDTFERDASPFPVSPGFDGDKRGGFFVERTFTAIDNEQTKLAITPQLFVQKLLNQGTEDFTSLFGLTTNINSALTPSTKLEGFSELAGLDLNQLQSNLRARLGVRQTLGNDVNPYRLTLDYTYRDRLYNGSLGFQTVQSSFGGLISSPNIIWRDTGVNIKYQVGLQYIDANTDRLDLLPNNHTLNRIPLSRLQANASLSKSFLLWQGKPLPATATAGMKYTPNPIVPYIQTSVGITGTTSYYSSGDSQSTLTGALGLSGQFGHFSRPYLDYTAFNITYFQGLNTGLSPFLFDRSVDNKVLTGGISQQIYGPLRLGFQTGINLDTGKQTTNDYILEYSRRTYGITLRYNPVLELGGFTIRISDFNWIGGTDPFSGPEVTPVVDGVRQQN